MATRFGFVVCGVGLLLSLTGCGGGGSSGPPLVDVKGKVDLDGKPMASGEVMFVQAGLVPDTLKVTGGTFSGKAKVGKARIEIRSYKPGKVNPMYKDQPPSDENFIPPAYNTNSTITAEVAASGPNEFTFAAKSK